MINYVQLYLYIPAFTKQAISENISIINEAKSIKSSSG